MKHENLHLKHTQPKKAGSKRKTISIASVMDSVGKYLILCVCDDGTIWQLANLYREGGEEPMWEPFPNPPGGPR
jgi:hypothetical protein